MKPFSGMLLGWITLLTLAVGPVVLAEIYPDELVAPEFEISDGSLNFPIQSSVSGRIYQLEHSDTMEAGTWTDVGESLSGDGSDLVIAIPYETGSMRRFYRLRLSEEDALGGFAAIPGGTFIMGSPDGSNGTTEELGRFPSETQHEVTVSSFAMKKTEVTNQELLDILNWAQNAGKLTVSIKTVMNAEGASRQELVDLDDSECRIQWNTGTGSFELKDSNYANHPAIEVTWYGGLAWCNYRSDMDGSARCYSFDDWSCDWTKDGYRLPTEAEWEYACRAGTSTAFHTGEISSTGSDPNMDLAGWYTFNSELSAHEVGGKQVNAYGLFDMHGNVFEWCWDWSEGSYYTSSPGTDPRGPSSGGRRVRRGGNWYYDAAGCRSAARSSDEPDYSGGLLGFRPARGSVPE